MNVTLKLPDETCRKARHFAVDENTSLSRWVADVVDAEIDGLPLQSRVAVTVTRSFDEWLGDWFGAALPENEDSDGDGVPLALEYARGSDPLRPDAAGWQEFDLPSRSLSWTRNPEALGTWTVETSLDLQTWNPTTLPVDPSPDRLTVTLPGTLPDRGFFRARFIPESSGN